MAKPRILLVEDDPIALGFLKDILENAHYDVLPAENGRVGLNRLSETIPDLIISDVVMPELNGLDLFRKLQDDVRYQNLPFIFLTSLDDGDLLVNLKALGTDDYLTKPIRPKHLLATVKGKLLRKQKRDEQISREQDRLKDRIQWTLSHELRTPLTVIQLVSELLLNGAQAPEGTDYHDLLMSLRSESWHLASLVENFLLVTRIDSGVEEETYKKEAISFNLSEVVDGVTYPFLDKARGQGAEFRVEVPSDLPPVFGVRGHVTQTLHQILDNAFKFADPKTPRVTMAALRDGPWVKIVIADNGRGVSPEGKEVLFQKLTQLDREVHEQQGSGLGLYISKKLLDINHGEISLECEPGQGAEVEIRIPVAAPAATQKTPPPAAGSCDGPRG